ncbi:MAG: FAD-binding oxidoreductase [Tahibacter sp.]
MADHFSLRLVSSYMLADSARHLAFERADGAPFAYVPGQFLQIHFHYPDGKATKRSYSVATIGADGTSPVQQIEIAVSYVEGGAATDLLANLKEGDTIDASGPYGRFCLFDTDANRRYLLVGTGTGVTPYRAMLPQLKRVIAERGVEVYLLFGARSERELLYARDFIDFEHETPGFRFYSCLSREQRALPRLYDRSGHVQATLAEIAPDAAGDIAYLCGNPNMVDEAFAFLKEAGLSVPHIRREKYVSSK